jgi:hypothetical protein
MNTTNDKKEQSTPQEGEKTTDKTEKKDETKAKPKEEPIDWMSQIQEFIKNPVTTGLTGLVAGYFLGTFKASKEIDTIKEEHKKQMAERDNQFILLVRQIQTTNKLIAAQKFNGLSLGEMENDEDDPDEDDENTLHFKKDKKTNTYKYQLKMQKKKQFELKG